VISTVRIPNAGDDFASQRPLIIPEKVGERGRERDKGGRGGGRTKGVSATKPLRFIKTARTRQELSESAALRIPAHYPMHLSVATEFKFPCPHNRSQ